MWNDSFVLSISYIIGRYVILYQVSFDALQFAQATSNLIALVLLATQKE